MPSKTLGPVSHSFVSSGRSGPSPLLLAHLDEGTVALLWQGCHALDLRLLPELHALGFLGRLGGCAERWEGRSRWDGQVECGSLGRVGGHRDCGCA